MAELRSAEDLTKDPQEDETEKVDAFIEGPVRGNDPRALKKKAISDKQKSIEAENDLRVILSSAEGLRFMARLISGPCGWNLPYFHPSNSTMCEIAGRRSIAYQLEQWICDVGLEYWVAVRTALEDHRAKPKEKSESGKPSTA